MDHLLTEARNPASAKLDEMTALELVRLMNTEDAMVPAAVAGQAEAIAQAIVIIADRLRNGGRLIYAGAGTSGRLGVLDATECPPTFNSPPGQVVGIIAGGARALTQAVEGAEDHPEFAEQDLQALQLRASDVVVGIATSGRTPYVLGAVEFARRIGAFTIGLACNPESELGGRVDLAITVPVGPEVLSGSTRLKAGTATKLVLNMLTTGAMIRLGKAYGNLMVDLRATNEKLRARTNRIVRHLTGLSVAEADGVLERCGGELKTALVTQLGGTTPDDARHRLQSVGGQVSRALSAIGLARPTIRHANLVLGIDGGGSGTVALLAQCDGETGPRKWTSLGRGEAGPSNIRASSNQSAFAALDQAIELAFAAAKLPRGPVAAVCFGLAGAGRAAERELIREWAAGVRVADKVEVTNDASLILAAGTPDGWGLGLIAGTGSFAYAKGQDGQTSRAGGWGYLLGDEGSGYAIALAGMQAVARAADGRGAGTMLTERMLNHLRLGDDPQALVSAVYGGRLDRPAIAALAPIVCQAAADSDLVAGEILDCAAQALAETATAAARRLFPSDQIVPLALAGGLLVSQASYREKVLHALAQRGVECQPIAVVAEPAEGAVRLAANLVQR